MNAKVIDGELVISVPMETPTPSASGKTLIVASSHGIRSSTIKVDGKDVCVVANAFIYADSVEEQPRKILAQRSAPMQHYGR
jgi:hypothetical protein